MKVANTYICSIMSFPRRMVIINSVNSKRECVVPKQNISSHHAWSIFFVQKTNKQKKQKNTTPVPNSDKTLFQQMSARY